MNKNLKKVISSAAVVAMVASSASAFAATFPDVDASATYAGAVSNLSALGIVQGDENGLFNPDNTVTRAEFAKMVVESLGKGDAAAAITSTDFADCVGHWGAGYIATGVSEGFINGYGDGNFGPNDTVTYAQAVKMLVAAIGYDMQATQLGGYPSGYLSYGSTLDITKGVSGVTNDTALTRAQCAVLVSNALQAPVCVVDGYTYGGLTGNVPQPNLVEKNGKGEEWQTLLTKFHDAYVVKGRVVNTSRTSSGLDAGEVQFQVESADNFDGDYIVKTDTVTQDMLVGDTAAEDMFRVYAEAIVQYNDSTDEWTILSINAQGSNKTVEFDASLVSEDEDYSASMLSDKKIPVQKSESSSSVTAYKLADDVEVYVNGVKVDGATDETLSNYILSNATGTVTLIDETETGSTSTDGYYDCVMISYYADAVVDYTQSTTSYNRVGFKAYNNNIGSRMQWDPEDDDITVTFTKDGAEVEWTELAEYDVLSIAYDVTGDFSNSTFYDVMVAQNTVTGTVSSRSEADEVVRIDGTEYDVVTSMVDLSSTGLELNGTYTFYLNAFNYVVYADENDSSKNVGILVGMYTSAGNDYATIRYIDPEGNIVAKEAKDADEEAAFVDFYQKATGNTDTEFTKTAFTDDNAYVYVDEDGNVVADGTAGSTKVSTISRLVFEYSLSSGKLRFKEGLEARGAQDLEYKANSTRLGSYTLNESVTKILDLDAYLNEDDSSVGVMSLSSFEDEATYTAYLYDRNSNNDYRLCLVLAGTGSINPETSIGVVMSAPQQTSIDGTEYWTMNVAKDGQEDVTVNYEYTDDVVIEEGDIVIYSLKADGTTSNLEVVLEAESDYYALFDSNKIPAMSEKINTIDANNVWKWTSASKPAKAYFGPVYQKSNNNLELFLSETDGQSNILNDTEVFNISTADTYVYDYSSAKKYRVTAGAVPNAAKSIYNNDVLTGDEKEIVDWAAAYDAEINPSFAFVKEVDGDVTEVVFFLAK